MCKIRWWRAVSLVFLSICVGGGRGRQMLLDLDDVIREEDIQAGGNCVNGCVRRLSNAVAAVEGQGDCDLIVQNLLDHRDSDVRAGTLNIVHACTGADGDLKYQGNGECLYTVCAQAVVENGLMTYSVVIEHQATSQPHSVRLQVYLNLYDEIILDGGGGGAASATGSSASSPVQGAPLSCTIGSWCQAPTGCTSEETAVEIVTEDVYGHGWAGALPGRMNSWTIHDGQDELVASSTLAAGHYSNATELCLTQGSYTFSSTAYAAFSPEDTWSLCGGQGAAGGTLDFQVVEGSCEIVDDSGATGPPGSSAETDPDDYCDLPRDTSCIEFGVGVAEPSGPSVGMYYDEACLDGGGGRSGCGGGGVVGCRVCFVNRENWLTDFPDRRYPDWGDCPCCVAESLDVACQGGFEGTLASDPSFFEEAGEYYTQGRLPVLVVLSLFLGVCIVVAICCARAVVRERKTLESLRKGDAAVLDSSKGHTSPETSPESRQIMTRPLPVPASAQSPTSPLRPKLSYSQGLKSKSTSKAKVQEGKDKASAAADRPLSLPKPAEDGRGGSESQAPPRSVPSPKEASPRASVMMVMTSRRAASVGDAAPSVPEGGDAAPSVPEGGDAAPSVPEGGDAAPSVPEGGAAADSGAKKSRWSGGTDARAFMGMGTYNRMMSDDEIGGGVSPALGGVSEHRPPDSTTAATGASRLLQMLKSARARGKGNAGGGDPESSTNSSKIPAVDRAEAPRMGHQTTLPQLPVVDECLSSVEDGTMSPSSHTLARTHTAGSAEPLGTDHDEEQSKQGTGHAPGADGAAHNPASAFQKTPSRRRSQGTERGDKPGNASEGEQKRGKDTPARRRSFEGLFEVNGIRARWTSPGRPDHRHLVVGPRPSRNRNTPVKEEEEEEEEEAEAPSAEAVAAAAAAVAAAAVAATAPTSQPSDPKHEYGVTPGRRRDREAGGGGERRGGQDERGRQKDRGDRPYSRSSPSRYTTSPAVRRSTRSASPAHGGGGDHGCDATAQENRGPGSGSGSRIPEVDEPDMSRQILGRRRSGSCIIGNGGRVNSELERGRDRVIPRSLSATGGAERPRKEWSASTKPTVPTVPTVPIVPESELQHGSTGLERPSARPEGHSRRHTSDTEGLSKSSAGAGEKHVWDEGQQARDTQDNGKVRNGGRQDTPPVGDPEPDFRVAGEERLITRRLIARRMARQNGGPKGYADQGGSPSFGVVVDRSEDDGGAGRAQDGSYSGSASWELRIDAAAKGDSRTSDGEGRQSKRDVDDVRPQAGQVGEKKRQRRLGQESDDNALVPKATRAVAGVGARADGVERAKLPRVKDVS